MQSLKIFDLEGKETMNQLEHFMIWNDEVKAFSKKASLDVMFERLTSRFKEKEADMAEFLVALSQDAFLGSTASDLIRVWLLKAQLKNKPAYDPRILLERDNNAVLEGIRKDFTGLDDKPTSDILKLFQHSVEEIKLAEMLAAAEVDKIFGKTVDELQEAQFTEWARKLAVKARGSSVEEKARIFRTGDVEELLKIIASDDKLVASTSLDKDKKQVMIELGNLIEGVIIVMLSKGGIWNERLRKTVSDDFVYFLDGRQLFELFRRDSKSEARVASDLYKAVTKENFLNFSARKAQKAHFDEWTKKLIVETRKLSKESPSGDFEKAVLNSLAAKGLPTDLDMTITSEDKKLLLVMEKGVEELIKNMLKKGGINDDDVRAGIASEYLKSLGSTT